MPPESPVVREMAFLHDVAPCSVLENRLFVLTHSPQLAKPCGSGLNEAVH
jgi:hypothetical protein